MKTTIEVNKADLVTLLGEFDIFIEEDHNSCDVCKFCGFRYGNSELLLKKGKKLEHHKDCSVLVAQDLGTRL